MVYNSIEKKGRDFFMLLYLKMNNCFIFDKEVEFSLEPNMHQKRFINNLTTINGIGALKSAIIMGPNNTGKTNFVKVLSVIKDIMLNGQRKMMSNLFIDNSICHFEIGFLSDDKEYSFEVKYDSSLDEYIYESFKEISYDSHKNRKERKIFVRDSINKVYFSNDNSLSNVMSVSAKSNILIYLLDVNQFPLLAEVKEIITSFASKIDIVNMNNIPIKKTMDMLKKSDKNQQKIVDFILCSDLYLEDFRYLNDDEFKNNLDVIFEGKKPEESVLNDSAILMDMLHLSSVYKGKSVPSLIFDSTGTKKMAALASYVIDALENERILVVDELDNSLHFRLTRAVISLFNNDINSRAQLICTVHDISLLDCRKLFRKDQIWFTHKDKENVYLYPLTEFTSEGCGVRETSDLIEKYKKGVFGALPEPDLLRVLIEEGDVNY